MYLTKQIDPDFESIIPLCYKELNIKFPDYGNSWQEEPKSYWEKRLSNEVDEYIKSMSVASELRKLLNIINMAAMAYQTLNDSLPQDSRKI